MPEKKIIGLIGKKQSGKDTVGSILIADHGYFRVALADPLKEALYRLNPIIEAGGYGGPVTLRHYLNRARSWDEAKQNDEVRRLLQELGLSMRETIDENIWLDAAMRRVERCFSPVVVTDVRFPNEAQAILDRGGYLWRIERPGVDTSDRHISENALNDWPTMKTIVNDGTIEDLQRKVKEVLAWPTAI